MFSFYGMSEADPHLHNRQEAEFAARVARLKTELQRGLDSGVSLRTVRQIIDDNRKRRAAA